MPTQWYGSRGPVAGCTAPSRAASFAASHASGELPRTDRVKKDGMAKSVSARRVKGLFAPPAGPD